MEKNEEKNNKKRKSHPTTYDNPWNPWTHNAEWTAFDNLFGYHTWQKVAILGLNSTNLNEFEDDEATEMAIDELCELLPAIYTRIYQPL